MTKDFSKQEEKERLELEKLEKSLKKIKIKKQEIRIKQRKRDSHEKITMGALIKKSGIGLNNNELLGMLLDAKERIEREEDLKKKWSDKGAKAFEEDQKKDKTRRDWEGNEAILVSFKSEPSKETKNSLKSLDLIWNKHIRVWQGFAKKEDAEKILEGSGAKIETVKLCGRLNAF